MTNVGRRHHPGINKQRHNQALRGGSKSPKFINLPLALASRIGPIGTADELLEKAAQADRSSRAKRVIRDIVGLINKHAKAIDTFTQAAPIAPFVWGSIRVLLEVVHDHEEAATIVAEGVRQVLKQMVRWRELTACLATAQSLSDHVRNATVDVYVETLGFLTSARKYFGHGRASKKAIPQQPFRCLV